MRTMTVSVKGHGSVDVYRARDEAGNDRMIPVHGAATLEQWRADQTRLAPWLLSTDLDEGQDWGAIMGALREMETDDLADDYAESRYESEGEAAYGRDD